MQIPFCNFNNANTDFYRNQVKFRGENKPGSTEEKSKKDEYIQITKKEYDRNKLFMGIVAAFAVFDLILTLTRKYK